MAPVSQQAFMQALMARGTVRETEARDLYKRATGAANGACCK